MFVVGRAVELEVALRAVGRATARATYAVEMAKRADTARRAVIQLARILRTPELVSMARAAQAAGLSLNNGRQLNAVADQVASFTQQLVDRYDGSTFAAIDRYVPSPSAYKGQPVR